MNHLVRHGLANPLPIFIWDRATEFEVCFSDAAVADCELCTKLCFVNMQSNVIEITRYNSRDPGPYTNQGTCLEGLYVFYVLLPTHPLIHGWRIRTVVFAHKSIPETVLTQYLLSQHAVNTHLQLFEALCDLGDLPQALIHGHGFSSTV